jgi:nucleotidyltransferase substrate binding protein (TIGR01987 family)
VARLAFRRVLVESGEIWMDMIKSRNRTSHTYDEKIAEAIVSDVRSRYFQEFVLLEERLNRLKEAEGT